MSILTLTGIEAFSQEGISKKTGKPYKFDEIKFYCQAPILKGGRGQKHVLLRLNGAANIDKYSDIKFPAKIKGIYETDYSYGKAYQALTGIEFVKE